MTVTIVLLASVAAPVLVMALFVEDWSRDLTTNTASTREDHPDPRLRPVDWPAGLEDAKRAVAAFAEERPHWRIANEKPAPADSPIAGRGAEPESVTHLVRTTGLMRYRDDVWLVAESLEDGGVRLHADSRSRVGKGDLGQNPRNLRELLGALREGT